MVATGRRRCGPDLGQTGSRSTKPKSVQLQRPVSNIRRSKYHLLNKEVIPSFQITVNIVKQITGVLEIRCGAGVPVIRAWVTRMVLTVPF